MIARAFLARRSPARGLDREGHVVADTGHWAFWVLQIERDVAGDGTAQRLGELQVQRVHPVAGAIEARPDDALVVDEPGLRFQLSTESVRDDGVEVQESTLR